MLFLLFCFCKFLLVLAVFVESASSNFKLLFHESHLQDEQKSDLINILPKGTRI